MSTGQNHAATALDDALRALTHDGWAFHWPRDHRGDIVMGQAARFYPGGWWDGLILLDASQSVALRVDPDNRETWRREGPALDMIHAVRELPRPGEHSAPTLAGGLRVPALWTPGTAR